MIFMACAVSCVACSPFGTIIGIVPSSMYGSGSSGTSSVWLLSVRWHSIGCVGSYCIVVMSPASCSRVLILS